MKVNDATDPMDENTYDVIVIGGGQSALALGYYLRKTKLNYLFLDKEEQPGGSWLHYWDSLQLFSPAQWSSLPGILMPGGVEHYPTRNETLEYLNHYEERYQLPVKRPVEVQQVKQDGERFSLITSAGTYYSKAVISATGSFNKPFVPEISGLENFSGQVIHSSRYRNNKPFNHQQVLVVGEGNSGAQILAEVSKVARTYWATSKVPKFLPDDIDGRVLFDHASAMYAARQAGKSFTPPSLGDVVAVPAVREARERGAFSTHHFISHFTREGVVFQDGEEQVINTVIFCTGFRPSLDHLQPLGILEADGKIETEGTRALKTEGLWLVGYGSWTGFASATLIGVGRTAKQTAREVEQYLS
jgi:putative flavoprotein involved in K+ transport